MSSTSNSADWAVSTHKKTQCAWKKQEKKMNGTKDDRDDGECWTRQMFALYDNNIFIRLGRNFCFAACHLNIAMFGVMASMFVTNNQIICMVNDNTNEKQYQSHFQDSLHHFSIISFAYWELCYVRCMQQAFIFCGCHCYGNSIIRFQVHLYLYSIRIGFFLPLASSLRAGAVFEQFFSTCYTLNMSINW